MPQSNAASPRADGRAAGEMRPLSFELDLQMHAAGSVLVAFGDTKVLCAATIAEEVPRWMRGSGRGWVTAEYNMLPAATDTRSRRQRTLDSGRTKEISRLIGRSLRAVTDLDALGEREITIDCDVIQADGGTRTAAVTGGWLALNLAAAAICETPPFTAQVAAVSVGIVGGDVLVDLCYGEDSAAEVDLNLVLSQSAGETALVEVQVTAEGATFTRAQLGQMLDAGTAALQDVFQAQRGALAAAAAQK